MERDDLGALFARITRRLVDAERPLLAAHELSMWGYVVLSHLARSPTGTQLELARAIGHDKTRLVTLLDHLQAAGLITRTPDPTDRRARTVTLTTTGRERHAAARSDIRAMEDHLLADLDPDERENLLAVLPRLASGLRDGNGHD